MYEASLYYVSFRWFAIDLCLRVEYSFFFFLMGGERARKPPRSPLKDGNQTTHFLNARLLDRDFSFYSVPGPGQRHGVCCHWSDLCLEESAGEYSHTGAATPSAMLSFRRRHSGSF